MMGDLVLRDEGDAPTGGGGLRLALDRTDSMKTADPAR